MRGWRSRGSACLVLVYVLVLRSERAGHANCNGDCECEYDCLGLFSPSAGQREGGMGEGVGVRYNTTRLMAGSLAESLNRLDFVESYENGKGL